MQPDKQNQYNFILDPSQGQRSGGPNFGDKKRQKIIGVVFVLVALLVVVLIASLIFSGGNSNNDGLISLRAHQTEIGRVITLGQKNISDPQVKQQLGTLKVIMTSDQKQLASLLSTRKVEVTKLQLNSKKDKNTDTALSDAIKTGNHDETLQQTLKSLVEKYYNTLVTAEKQTSSAKEKSILNTAASNIEIIYK